MLKKVEGTLKLSEPHVHQLLQLRASITHRRTTSASTSKPPIHARDQTPARWSSSRRSPTRNSRRSSRAQRRTRMNGTQILVHTLIEQPSMRIQLTVLVKIRVRSFRSR